MEKKYCIVPQCYNSTVRTPGKLFFYVPEDPVMRKKWMTAAKRVVSIGPKTKAHCCEDHFDVENDMENYVKYKLVGGKLKLKKGVVPHKFACQKQSVEKPKRTFVKKLKIAKLTTSSSECTASTSHDVEKIYIVDSIPPVQDVVNDPLKDVTRDENLCSTTEDNLKTKHKKIYRGSFSRPSHLLTAPKQQHRTPASLFSCNNETGSGDDRVHEDDSIYERDVSRNKTECDKTQSETDRTHNETDSGDDRVDEDFSIYERHVSPTKTEDDDGEATVPEGSSPQEGCRCHVCRGDIVGFRYACVQCDNFDLCGACEARGEHATHYVLRIPANKLHSDVQAVIERIRDQMLEEYSIKLEVKEEVLEQDPLEETTSPDADIVQETSCQDTKREESEDTLDLNLLDRSEREKQPVFEVSPSYPPPVPQVLSEQSKVLSHQPKVLSHQSKVLSHQSKVLSHRPNILIRQPRIRIRKLKDTSKTPEVQSEIPQAQSHLLNLLIQQPKVLSITPEVQSEVPQVLPHQPQVAPSAKSHEKRPLMIEEQSSTSEELNPVRKKRKELNPVGEKRKELNPAGKKRKELNPDSNKRKVLNPKSKKRKQLIV